ncbi:hypothetical protein SNN83_002737 [Cronobacter malonaticus]|nr:hypothetical protein [Cronobacter malonaticus]
MMKIITSLRIAHMVQKGGLHSYRRSGMMNIVSDALAIIGGAFTPIKKSRLAGFFYACEWSEPGEGDGVSGKKAKKAPPLTRYATGQNITSYWSKT